MKLLVVNDIDTKYQIPLTSSLILPNVCYSSKCMLFVCES
jgi:hypothetical protein